MTPAKGTPTTTKSRRPRLESYADWMARVDQEVDSMARQMERKPPTYADLHPAQRRIVQMLIDFMRALPPLGQNEWPFEKPQYAPVKEILRVLFLLKYPEWEQAKRFPDGKWDVDRLPREAAETYTWILRNCAGRAPIEPRRATQTTEEDDD